MAEISSRYWYYHAFFVGAVPLGALGVGAFVVLETSGVAAAGSIGGAAGLLFLGGVLVATVGGLIGYIAEAKLLREAGSAWVPTWPVYVVAHLLISPFLTAPIYLIQRWRHVGLGSSVDVPDGEGRRG